MTEAVVKVAVISSAHGIRGEVKLKSLVADNSLLTRHPLLDAAGAAYRLTLTGSAGDLLIMRAEGISDRNRAETLKGKELFLERSILPPAGDEEFYRHELVGLAVHDEAGDYLGDVSAVHNFGAGDILEISLKTGESGLYAFNRKTFPLVDVENKRAVLIKPEEL